MTVPLKTRLERILGKPRGRGRLPAAKDRDPIPAGRGTAGPGSGSGDSSIASPLTETGRSYYATQELTSSDGLFVIQYQRVQSISFRDANGADVVINYS